MIVLIDNYDSFTYNLVQYFQILGQSVAVYKNDELTLDEIELLNPDHIVISPGPNSPDEAGISLAIIEHYHQDYPILGICLGHQCLAQAFGGQIVNAPQIMHGKTSMVQHNKQRLFRDLPSPFRATRYHSLCVDSHSLPASFHIDAWADDSIMAISHRQFPIFGLQFHPEAILTDHGINLLENFLNYESQPTL